MEVREVYESEMDATHKGTVILTQHASKVSKIHSSSMNQQFKSESPNSQMRYGTVMTDKQVAPQFD